MIQALCFASGAAIVAFILRPDLTDVSRFGLFGFASGAMVIAAVLSTLKV